MADAKASAPSPRAMKYPYTLTAKLVQFPYKFYLQNVWHWKYLAIAIGVSLPLFYKIGKMSYAPENVKVWDEKRRQMFTPGGHH